MATARFINGSSPDRCDLDFKLKGGVPLEECPKPLTFKALADHMEKLVDKMRSA